jgi:folate-dependent phosphoribosylglycinamide formyltransferase PurN
MCRKYDMLNLHPAVPGGPTGTWQEVIWKLIETGAQETGVMMHLATPELDKGPPVTYCAFSIRGKPFDRYWSAIAGRSIEEIQQTEGENNGLFKLIREYGLARELPLIVATIKAFADGKVRVTPNKQVVDAEGKPIKGYNLTGEIEGLLKQGGKTNS